MIDPNYTDNIEKYTKKEMDEARKINAKMRQLEREVRDLRKRQYLSQTKADQRLYAQKSPRGNKTIPIFRNNKQSSDGRLEVQDTTRLANRRCATRLLRE